jgi:hypothetical protein
MVGHHAGKREDFCGQAHGAQEGGEEDSLKRSSPHVEHTQIYVQHDVEEQQHDEDTHRGLEDIRIEW